MHPILPFTIALLFGYYLSLQFSHPRKKKHYLPNIRLRNIEILPNFRIHFRNKTYWLHHWVYLSVATIVLFLSYDSISHLLTVKAAAIGGILQGLRYPDRFKFRHPRNSRH